MENYPFLPVVMFSFFAVGLPIVLALLGAVVSNEAIAIGAHEVGLLARRLARRIGTKPAVMIVSFLLMVLAGVLGRLLLAGLAVYVPAVWGLGFLGGAIAATLLRDWMTWQRLRRK